MSEFNQPSSADGISFRDLNGSLLLFKVHAVETIRTKYDLPGSEPGTAVRADVTVLDGDQGGTEYADTLVFPRVLQKRIRDHVGELVLGRLTQGNAKPGQTAPWDITAATPAEEQTARDHLAKKTQPAFASPAQGSPPF